MIIGQSATAKLVISTATAAQRAASEDRVLVAPGPAGLLVLVADGAGGMRGGARAADLLVEHVRGNLFAVAAGGTTAGAVSDTLRTADRRIAKDPAAGETTAVALVVSDDQLIGASAGDSEAWLLNGDDGAVLTASQGRRRIGSGRAEPVSFARSFTSGIAIIGTDGLFAYATPDAICRVTRSAPPEAMAAGLIDLVRLPRGNLADDTAVVVVVRV